jgi:hypothetical protein
VSNVCPKFDWRCRLRRAGGDIVRGVLETICQSLIQMLLALAPSWSLSSSLLHCTWIMGMGGVIESSVWDINVIGNTSPVSESKLNENAAAEKMVPLLSGKETW